MKKPLITVITVVYNSVKTFRETLESVVNQDKSLFEYWIIDGGSTDGSVELIRSYESQLAGWVSERDKGIYDAMNKGIDKSAGEWIYFLGADDTLLPGALSAISAHLKSPNKIVYGDVRYSNNHLFRSFLGPRTLLQNTLHHQGSFYHRSLFDSFRYDLTLPIHADYELNLIAYIQKWPTKYVPILVSNYALGGYSSGSTDQSLRELNQIRSRHMQGRLKNVGLSVFLRLYYWQKRLRFWLYGHQG